jgi:hypothetical protein
VSHRDPELEDPRLRAALRDALAGQRAPDAWVQSALSAADAALVSPAPRSWIKLVVPHLCGLGLLLGLVIALFLRPEAASEAWSQLSRGLPSGLSFSLDGFSQSELLAMVSTPLLIYFLYQGSRGFPILNRHR